MPLLLGTDDGVYRTSRVPFDDATQTLAAGRVMRVRHFPGADGAFACSRSGLYRSTDGGTAWSELGVPREEVYSVRVSPDGERLYAGRSGSRNPPAVSPERSVRLSLGSCTWP